MKLLTLASLAAQAVSLAEWEKLPLAQYDKYANKEKFIDWCKSIKTKHGFVSGIEALNPERRVSADNPPYAIRAVIADYDAAFNDSTEALIARAVKRCAEHPPTHACRTYSGGARLFWELESPVIGTPTLLKRVVKALAKEIGLTRALQGHEASALADLSKYYEPGVERSTLQSPKLSTNMVNHILLAESSRVDWGTEAETISIELVAEAVEMRFPGVWEGPFIIGARGPRFWDGTADNPTAAIVRESGMQCFTGTEAFVPWGAIFGAGFVREASDNRIGRAVDGFAFDGQRYWKEERGAWVDYSRIDCATHMRVAGLEPTEVDAALVMIQTQKRVEAAVPLAFWPTGLVPLMGKRVINTFSRKLVLPVEEEQEWGERFPRLAAFLGGLFEPVDGEDTQLVHYLAWLRRFYTSCYNRKPEPGQVIFVAGDVDQGKTFLSNVVLNRIFGGSVDASAFLLGADSFTGHLFETAVWHVDDTKPSHDHVHAKYSAMIKKVPANQLFLYNEKFVRARMIPWLGRIMVSCNLDTESLRILPDVETSLLDKIMLFKVQTREGFNFKSLIKELDDELPHFLKWLMDWDPLEDDPSVLEASRYEVASYHHPDLLRSAREVTDSHSFLELLSLFMADYTASSGETSWTGTPTELLRHLAMDDSMKPLVAGMTSKSMGRRLGQLKNQGAPVKQARKDHWRVWVIEKDLTSWQSADHHTSLRDDA